MTTAIDVITDALFLIEVISSENSIQADMVTDSLRTLNDLGIEWEEIYALGFTPVTVLADSITIPRASVSAFKSELALRLAPQFGAQVSASLARLAKDSRNALRRNAVTIKDVKYPDSLPIGSGNRCEKLIDDTFFPQNNIVNF